MNDNFYNWFKDSKTIDSNGVPIIFYHRSRSKEQFNQFNPKGVQKNVYNNDFGIYFVIQEYKYAIDYIADGVEYYCYLRIINPLYIYDNEKTKTDSIGNHYDLIELSESFCNSVIEKGYDGIIIISKYYNQYIVFESNQIKHINNTGTYSESEDIFN